MSKIKTSSVVALPAVTFEAAGFAEAAALGDRLAFLKRLLAWLGTLDLTLDELLALVAMATDLFQEFSLAKLLAFLKAVKDALAPAASDFQATAFQFGSLFQLLMLLLQLFKED